MKKAYIPLLASLFFFLATLSFLQTSITNAAQFDAGLIISDYELFDSSSMTLEEIQAFLDSHTGTLNKYYDTDVDGHVKTASMIFSP